MKAERRHQLQSNSLVHVMENLPEYGKRYGSQILLGITVLLLIGVVIRWRLASADQNLKSAALSLDAARNYVDRVRVAPLSPASGKDGSLISRARSGASSADAAITDVFSVTDDPRFVAEARLLRADLYWALANLPTGATDADKSGDKLPKTAAEYLAQAGETYASVLSSESKSPHDAVIRAHFGMAAVNENQLRWDDARKQFEAVVNDPAAGEAFKTRAAEEIRQEGKIRVAPLLASAPAPDAADSQLPGGPMGPPKPSTTQAETKPAATSSTRDVPTPAPLATTPQAPSNDSPKTTPAISEPTKPAPAAEPSTIGKTKPEPAKPN